MKLLKIFLVLIVPLNLYAQDMSETAFEGIQTVVIDPGHGGKDPGAIGKKVYEKEINLAVALGLGKLIEEWFPNIKVLYTRTADVSVALIERSNLANRNNADLFISIHTNAVENEKDKTKGNETYIMGLHRSKDNLKVAIFENSAIKYEDNYEDKYDGFDPSDPESYIMFSLIQDEYLEQSLKMAEFIQEEFQSGPIVKDRGVKQDGFLVLYKTAAPSVLIELGFISHPEEELVLMDKDNQQRMAECIFKAFKRYKNHIENYAAGRFTDD
ncbi:MAG: N-acetylmuramoyl-L-alanine amidase [Prevotellaceae bacterium]|jgi:N-acetylmuramoyl-L-alanine amidase|nr:N-acetylmuramoyl-L-alanine amidase [Prevotellaceae bacterium]